MPRAKPQPKLNPEAVLTKAVSRAAERFGLGNRDLAAVLGISEASASRLASGQRTIPERGSERERALYFLRIYRSLDSLVGGEQDKARAWFNEPNTHLGGVPAEIVRSGFKGLDRVAEYLDAMRGKL